MKPEYLIHFEDGGERRYVPRHSVITNRVRASLRVVDISILADSIEELNKFMCIVLDTDDDFTDALMEDTDAVCADFFTLFSPKTKG